MSTIHYNELSFSRLKKQFNDRVFAIPQIQRQFVWKQTQVCDLMDSIYKHLPIGVFLVWKTTGVNTADLRPNNNSIILPFNYENRTAEIIIDGQQRLSTLFGILKGVTPNIEENSTLNFTKFFFSLKKEKKTQTEIKRFFYLPKLEGSNKNFISLYEILNFSPSVLINRYSLSLHHSKILKKCCQNFKSYKFYSLVIETLDPKEVEETFIRINSKGMTVKRADILFARTSKVGLRDRVRDTRRGLTYGFNNLKIDTFNSMIALAEGGTSIGKEASSAFIAKFEKKKMSKTEFKKQWKKYSYAFSLANDYLVHEFKITNIKFLPSENIFTILSLFFYNNSKRPSTFQRKQLKKWFWHTTFGERYSGANFNKNIPKDIKFIKDLSHGKKITYKINSKIDPNEFLKKSYSSKRSMAVRGYYLFLKMKNPRYLDNGHIMFMENNAAIANRRDRHHIFPQDLFKKTSSRWMNSLLNICLLASNNNQSIGGVFPSIYLKKYIKKPFFKKVLRSHIIPVESKGLWSLDLKFGFKNFLNSRALQLIPELEKIAGAKLFESFEEIKRI